MKKAILLLLPMIMFSCSSDNSDNNNSNNLILGKWIEQKKINYYENGTIHSEYNNSLEPCYGMTTYEFKNNSEFVKDSYDYINSQCSQNPLRTGNWNMQNNTLMITINNNTENSQLEFIDSQKMKLKKTDPGNLLYDYSIVEYKKID